jgi:hypothetical protein
MFKFRISILTLIGLTLTFTSTVAQEPVNPYIYYYASDLIDYYISELTTFIVERADGTDQKEFGRDALAISQDEPFPVPYTYGPGWSPDGRWFAFARAGEGRPDGFILRLDGMEYVSRSGIYSASSTRADAIEDLWSVWEMYWSPDSQYLLVLGNPDWPSARPGDFNQNVAYWLIDVQTNRLIGQLDYRWGMTGLQYTPIEWNLDEGSVTFYIAEDDLNERYIDHSPQITMYFDGRVVKQPWIGGMISLEDTYVYRGDVNILSPSGRYRVTSPNLLTDEQTQTTIELPRPDFGDLLEEYPYLVQVLWDTTETWAILGYNMYTSGGVDGIAIVRADGTGFRVLSAAQCIDLGNACVGWLPDNVDVDNIRRAGEITTP